MRTGLFPTVRSEGGILPPDLLVRVVERKGLDGTTAESYGLDEGLQVNEAVARSWNRLLGVWAAFRNARARLPEHDLGVTVTRQKWLLPLFEELRFGRVQQGRAATVDGKNYAIYALWNGRVPLHLQGCRVELDRRTEGVAGAAATSPHGLVQEYLNRDTSSLWGVVTNGLRLRLLRDSARIAKQSYVEFDLESMMEGEVYGDFALLWMVCHQSRFEGERPDECWLERWSTAAQEEGTRALEKLREGVETAIAALGSGFLADPANGSLRKRLRDGALSTQDYYRQLLRLVYRLIFLFAAEDRGVLLRPGPEHEAARARFLEFYSTARLRRLAGARRGTAHHDLYETLKLTARLLDADNGCPDLALPGLGSYLWSPDAVPDLAGAELANTDLLAAVRHLAWSYEGGSPRPVDYRNLGAEELGSVYESLLELHPELHLEAATFALRAAAGSERKTTGSYYTPSSLIECLLDSALEPVVDEAIRNASEKAEEALLGLRVCDPACGSGHFLIAAAHRLARRLAALRSGDAEPPPSTYRAALRDVIGRCLYGVDLNPMAVELCKVSLWLEAMEPGKPLSFLEHHVRCGNSLLGATPELLARGLPDEAFNAIEGDDKTTASALKKRNRQERERSEQAVLAFETLGSGTPGALVQDFLELEAGQDADLGAQRRRAEQFARLSASDELIHARRVADAWCAAFVWRKTPGAPPAVTTDTVRALARNPRAIPAATRAEIERLASEYRLFHWHLEFPTVMGRGGFDVVVGNPPWELLEAGPGESARDEFARAQHWFRCNHYSILDGRRDLYKLFLINTSRLLREQGRVGFLTPLGVFIEDDASTWRRDFFDSGSVISLRHFQNSKKRFFPGVHASYRFCAVTYMPRPSEPHSFTTVATRPEHIASQTEVVLPRLDFDAWLGSHRSATIYPSREYAAAHRAALASLRELPAVTFRVLAEFHSSTDKALVRTSRRANSWALLRNRNIHFFNHEYAPHDAWIAPHDVTERLMRKGLSDPRWFHRFPRLVFRDIARNDDERTLIACLAPPGVVSSYDTPMFLPECPLDEIPRWLAFFAAVFSSFLFDFLLRPYVDKHIKGYTLARIPWPTPHHLSLGGIDLDWFVRRVLELTYVTDAFAPFAHDCGWTGPQFSADIERRFLLRCEVDAALFLLCLGESDSWPARLGSETSLLPTPRSAVELAMDSFPIVKKTDAERHKGNYRTKEIILKFYDAMKYALESGKPYTTALDPPPADPRCTRRAERWPRRS